MVIAVLFSHGARGLVLQTEAWFFQLKTQFALASVTTDAIALEVFVALAIADYTDGSSIKALTAITDKNIHQPMHVSRHTKK